MKRTVNKEFLETNPPCQQSGIPNADQRGMLGLNSAQVSLVSFPIIIGNKILLFSSRNKFGMTFSKETHEAKPRRILFD
jgi:hypothetical protein